MTWVLAPQWSPGTSTRRSRHGRGLTTCRSCRRPSARATPRRATGSGTWNPTAPPPTSGPHPCTHPSADKVHAAHATLCSPLGAPLHLRGPWGPCVVQPPANTPVTQTWARGRPTQGVSAALSPLWTPGTQLRPRPSPTGGSLFVASSSLGAGHGTCSSPPPPEVPVRPRDRTMAEGTWRHVGNHSRARGEG